MAGNYKKARATDGKKLEVGRTFQAEHRQGSEAQLTQLKNQREQALWAGVESPGTKLRMVVGHWGATRGFRAGGSHSQISFVQGPSGCHEEEVCLWDKTGWEPRELPGSTGGAVGGGGRPLGHLWLCGAWAWVSGRSSRFGRKMLRSDEHAVLKETLRVTSRHPWAAEVWPQEMGQAGLEATLKSGVQ